MSSSSSRTVSLVAIAVIAAVAVLVQLALRSPAVLHEFDKFLDRLQDPREHLEKHIYLNGNFAPVSEEHTNPVPVQVVEGALPEDLDGLFVRNGPNPIPSQMSKRYHWFDGHGMLHTLRIRRGGQATYANMYIPTQRYQIEKEMGEEFFGHVGELTGWIGLIKALFTFGRLSSYQGLNGMTANQANTHTIMYDNKFLCGHEASLPFEIELSDDGTIVKGIGFEDFGGVLNFPVSAHPKKDPVTGNFLFHGYSGDPDMIKREAPIKVGEYMPSQQKVVSYLPVNPEEKHVSFAHDMMFTEHWIVLYDSSVLFDFTRILEPNASFFSFHRESSLRIGLVPRLSTDQVKANQTITSDHVVWFDTKEPHVMIHPLTAWEDSDGIVHLWSPVGDDFDGNIDTGSNSFYMTEYTLNPSTGDLKALMIDATHTYEFPRVRDECLGRFCRYGYAGTMTSQDGVFSGFATFDMEEKKLKNVVQYPDGELGGEPVVIPKAGRTESDAVYLGTFIFNTNDKQSYFVLYDGEGSHELVARLRIPHRVPYGFHGQWVTGQELQSHIKYHTSKRVDKREE